MRFVTFLLEKGLNNFWAQFLGRALIILFLLSISYLIYWFTRKIVLQIFSKLAKKTKSSFDDLLLKNKTAKRISHFLPILFLYEFLPKVISNYPAGSSILKNILEALTIVAVINLIMALLNTLKDYIKLYPSFKDKPIDSYIQVFMIFLWFIGIILILSVLTGKDIGTFLTTLGALSAVLLFVFKDTILGFVASVQLTRINKIILPGNTIYFYVYK